MGSIDLSLKIQEKKKHERLIIILRAKTKSKPNILTLCSKQNTHKAQNHLETKPNDLKIQYTKKDQNLFSFGFVSTLSHIDGKQM